MGKMIVLTFADSEETAFQRAVSLLGGEFGVETVQPVWYACPACVQSRNRIHAVTNL